jgi:hypothetical protein
MIASLPAIMTAEIVTNIEGKGLKEALYVVGTRHWEH